MTERLRWGGTAAALALALSACGGSGGTNSEQAGGAPAVAAQSAVEVVAKDIAFDPAELTVGAGPTTIRLKNDGAIPHSLMIEGAPNFEKLEVADNGATDSAVLDVAPGTYTIYCAEPGHRAAGMETKLVVS